MLPVVVLGFDVAALVVVGRRAGRWLAPDGDRWDRALAGLLAALASLGAALTLAGVVGVLHPPVVLAIPLALGVAAWTLPSAPDAPTRPQPTPADSALLVLAAVAVAAYLAPGLAGSSQENDTLQYHVANLASYLDGGSILDLPFVIPGYFGNAYPDLHGLLAAPLVAVTGSDHLLYVANVPWAALVVLGIAVAAKRLGGDPRAGALLGLGLVLTPLVRGTQAAALTSDLAAAALVAAVGPVVAAARTHSSTAARRHLAVAGMAVGLAAASKYTAFAGAVGIVVLAALLVPADRRRLAVGTIAGITAVLTAPWLLRNLATTGNPLFPLDAGPLTGGDSPLVALDRSLLGHVADRNGSAIGTWWRLARSLFGPALLVAPAAFAVARTRSTLLTLGLGAAMFVAYAATPFTGGGEDGLAYLIASQLRYALPALAVLAAVAAVGPRRLVVATGVVELAWDALEALVGLGFRTDVDPDRPMAAWAVGLLVVVTAVAASGRRTRHPALVAGLATTAVAVGALAAQTDRGPTPAEALAQAHPGPVVAIGVLDVRSLLGTHLDVDLVAPTDGGVAGERPILDPVALDAALAELAASGAAVLALPTAEHPTLPDGWAPAAPWVEAGQQGTTRYFVPNPCDVTGCRDS